MINHIEQDAQISDNDQNGASIPTSVTSPAWRLLPVLLDTPVTEKTSTEALRSAGYSNKFEISAPFEVKRIVIEERPKHLYVTGDGQRSIHAFWFDDEGGTAEFDIVEGQLKHLDSYGCSIVISGSDLIVSPHRGGGDRLSHGEPGYRGPRNSEELFISVFQMPGH
jgi:hypothetical protein